MISKLLGELQEMAQVQQSNVLELLRRAKVVAVKLGHEEARAWIQHELNGYPDGVDVPPYREIPSVLKVRNAFHGWQPVVWDSAGTIQEHFAITKMCQAISEIVEIASSDGEPRTALTQAEMDVLMPTNPDLEWRPSARCFSRASFTGIVEAVRNRVLDWSLTVDAEHVRKTGAGAIPKEEPVTRQRPTMFIGSTAESLSVARAVHSELDYDLEITLWSQNVFEPGNSTWGDLVSQARSNRYDFALLVMGGEDQTTSRGTTSNAPRDNVLLELGLFCGALGHDRTFFLIDRDNKPKIASDLAGITALVYGGNRSDGNLQSAVAPACELIRQRVKNVSIRRSEESDRSR